MTTLQTEWMARLIMSVSLRDGGTGQVNRARNAVVPMDVGVVCADDGFQRRQHVVPSGIAAGRQLDVIRRCAGDVSDVTGRVRDCAQISHKTLRLLRHERTDDWRTKEALLVPELMIWSAAIGFALCAVML